MTEISKLNQLIKESQPSSEELLASLKENRKKLEEEKQKKESERAEKTRNEEERKALNQAAREERRKIREQIEKERSMRPSLPVQKSYTGSATLSEVPTQKELYEKQIKKELKIPTTPRTASPLLPSLAEMTQIQAFISFQRSPIMMIKHFWGLTPQEVLPEFEELVEENINNQTYYNIKAEHFAPYIKNRNITWQQWLILRGVELAISGKAKKRITVRSGHGIGKSTTMAWLVIWYLLFYAHSQIPCTAPTGDQLFDVLWKEIAKWIGKLPPYSWLKNKLEWQSSYIRNTESPETWFARAKTARKEAPEALAGIHGEYVLMIVDEASGVADEIFNVAEGALTEENTLLLMISNPTRLEGYFYKSHHGDQDNWQCMAFSCIDSPRVEQDYVDRIIELNGIDSDEYKIRVLGEFPRADAVDDKGYVPLLQKEEIKYLEEDMPFVGSRRMGIDPSGEGTDETRWIVRDKFQARIVAREKISNPKSIAQKTLTLMMLYNVQAKDVWIDNFGVGAEITKELALAGESCNGINVGDAAKDKETYINKRAEIYMRLRKWVQSGGKFQNSKEFEELAAIKFRRGLSGKVQIKSKQDMRKDGTKSPNTADALSLTFINEEEDELLRKKNKSKQFKPNYQKVSYNRK